MSRRLADAVLRASVCLWRIADAFERDGQDALQEILNRDNHLPVAFDEDGTVEAGLCVCFYIGRVVIDPSGLDGPRKAAQDSILDASAPRPLGSSPRARGTHFRYSPDYNAKIRSTKSHQKNGPHRVPLIRIVKDRFPDHLAA